MQHIFISSGAIERPPFFVIYRLDTGDHYQRIENTIDRNSFLKDSSAVRVELYRNGKVPVLVGVLVR
jgi:hypothetical protein